MVFIKDNKPIYERRGISNLKPILFLLLELTAWWLLIGLFHVDLRIAEWTVYGWVLLFGASFYSFFKTVKIFYRQKNDVRSAASKSVRDSRSERSI